MVSLYDLEGDTSIIVFLRKMSVCKTELELDARLDKFL